MRVLSVVCLTLTPTLSLRERESWPLRGCFRFPSGVDRHRFGGGHGWAQRHAAIFHQLQCFARRAVAMLDGGDACEDGAADAFIGGGVRRDVFSRRARFFNRGA